jgi:pyruvate,water dikinase
MTLTQGHVVPLAETNDEGRFGGKAVQLGAAWRWGLPVPDGMALSWEIVDRVAAGDSEARDACAAAFATLGSRPVAVRSSAVGEDSAAASFAGQHLTRLGVCSRAALADALVAVWASGRAPGALVYRQQLGLAGEPRVGIVLQHMVAAESAGVMFTKDPLTGTDVRLIEAAWGLGESVVAGLVDPDRYRVRRGGDIVEALVGDKHVAVHAVADGSTEERPVDDRRRRQSCLSGDQLRELDKLASACEHAFAGGAAHDIEWAFDCERLYLLQRRAVTR